MSDKKPRNKENGFLRLRRGIFKHLRDGWVDGDMFSAY